MQILFQDKTYDVSDDLVFDLLNIVLDRARKMYSDLPEAQQIIVDSFARGYLYKMEEKMLKKDLSTDEIMKFRPAKNEDATIKLIDVMTQITFSASKYIDLEFDVEDNVIKSLSYGMILSDEFKEKTI